NNLYPVARWHSVYILSGCGQTTKGGRPARKSLPKKGAGGPIFASNLYWRDDPRTLAVLSTPFHDSPEIATQTLLQRDKEGGVLDIEPKTVLLVLPRPEEALAVKHNGGGDVEDEQEGYELKTDQIDPRLTRKSVITASISCMMLSLTLA